MVYRVHELASPYIPANAKQKGAQIDRSSSRMVKHVRVRFCFVPELVCYVLIRRVQFFLVNYMALVLGIDFYSI